MMRMRSQLFRRVPAVCAMVLMICLSSCANPSAIRDEQDRSELTALAARLHVAEDWNAVRTFVHCHILAVGKTQAQAESELRVVDEYAKLSDKSAPSVMEYRFQEKPIQDHLNRILVAYDSTGRITKLQEFIYIGSSDELVAIKC